MLMLDDLDDFCLCDTNVLVVFLVPHSQVTSAECGSFTALDFTSVYLLASLDYLPSKQEAQTRTIKNDVV